MRKTVITVAVLLAVMFLGGPILLQAAGPEKKVKLITLEDTIKVAKQNNKDIIINFSDPGANDFCKKLEKRVFGNEKWKIESEKKYIFLSLDISKNENISPEQKEYNENLSKEFWVNNRMPAVFLLDSNGAPYARTAYQEESGTPKGYVEHLLTFVSRKKERDDLLKKARGAPNPDAKMPKYEDFIKKIGDWNVGFGYRDIKDEIINLKSNENDDLKGKCAESLYSYYSDKKNESKAKYYLEQLKEFDEEKWNNIQVHLKLNDFIKQYIEPKDWAGAVPELKKLFSFNPSEFALQRLHYFLALSYNGLGDREKTISNLENGVRALPNSELGIQMKKDLDNLKSQPPPPAQPPQTPPEKQGE